MARLNAPVGALTVWLLAATSGAILQTLVADPMTLAWDRAALDAAHQYWRLVTGPWIHLSWAHLGLNLAGLAVVLLMFARITTAAAQAVALVSICVLTDLLLWVVFPSATWRVGLLGPLHGLFAWAALRLVTTPDPAPDQAWWRGPAFGWVLLAGRAIKLALESLIVVDPQQVAWIGGPVLRSAHQAGTLAGLLVAAADYAWRRVRA
ncbi:rhombosortase [soil metagenome]